MLIRLTKLLERANAASYPELDVGTVSVQPGKKGVDYQSNCAMAIAKVNTFMQS